MSLPPIDPTKRYIVTKKFGRIELRKNRDGLWEAPDGTVYALAELQPNDDPSDNCGVYPFSIPGTAGVCKPHDYMYSSDAFQLFHTRKEADERLRSLLEQRSWIWRISAKPIYALTRMFGGMFWDNDKTK